MSFTIKSSSIYIKSPFVVVRSSFVTVFLRGNNSALGGHRALPKVANERYCYIFFIFGVGIAGTGAGKKNFLKKKMLFFSWLPLFLWARRPWRLAKKIVFLVGYQFFFVFFFVGRAAAPHGAAHNSGAVCCCA